MSAPVRLDINLRFGKGDTKIMQARLVPLIASGDVMMPLILRVPTRCYTTSKTLVHEDPPHALTPAFSARFH
jgi:hypothetical protein